MNYRQSPFGPVAIVPATALRNNRTLLRQLERSPTWHQQNGINENIPINLAYYPNTQNGVSKRTLSTPPSLPLAVPQSTTLPRPRVNMIYPTQSYLDSNTSPRLYRTRSFTTTSIFNEPISRGVPTYIKAVSGPVKYPEPLYRKRAYSRSRSADWWSSTQPTTQSRVGGWTPTPSLIQPRRRPTVVNDAPIRRLGRRPDRHYPASYATYPPSTFYGGIGKESQSDNVILRVALKVAQLVVGAVVIGTVAGPAQGQSFSTFAARTQTGGQIYVLVIACICLIMTAALLVTIYFKNSQMWRNVDGVFNGTAAFMYLVAGCVEAWYANCYPPYGTLYPDACRLVAWAIAAIFAFVNLVLYTVDFVLAAQAGISF